MVVKRAELYATGLCMEDEKGKLLLLCSEIMAFLWHFFICFTLHLFLRHSYTNSRCDVQYLILAMPVDSDTTSAYIYTSAVIKNDC